MTVQETIIEAFKASHSAHNRALATITSLRADKGSLEAEVARLNSQVASLRSQIAHLEAEAVKIVEPSSVQSVLASLLQIVEETQHATLPAPSSYVAGRETRKAVATPPTDRDRQGDTVPLNGGDRPVLNFQQRQSLEREIPQEALDATH